MVCGKKDLFQPFHDPFTTHSQPRGNQNPSIPTRLFGVFHKFPTPYYGYYNKFNIEKQVFASDPMGNDSKTDTKKER